MIFSKFRENVISNGIFHGFSQNLQNSRKLEKNDVKIKLLKRPRRKSWIFESKFCKNVAENRLDLTLDNHLSLLIANDEIGLDRQQQRDKIAQQPRLCQDRDLEPRAGGRDSSRSALYLRKQRLVA